MTECNYIYRYICIKWQHPVALRRYDFAFRFFAVYVQRRLIFSRCFLFVTTCFGLTGRHQVYRSSRWRNLLLSWENRRALQRTHDNLQPWWWPVMLKHIATIRRNNSRILADVANRRHKSWTQSHSIHVCTCRQGFPKGMTGTFAMWIVEMHIET
jgi:hypothetical protein